MHIFSLTKFSPIFISSITTLWKIHFQILICLFYLFIFFFWKFKILYICQHIIIDYSVQNFRQINKYRDSQNKVWYQGNILKITKSHFNVWGHRESVNQIIREVSSDIVFQLFLSWVPMHVDRCYSALKIYGIHPTDNLSILQVWNAYLWKGSSYHTLCTVCVSFCTHRKFKQS